MSASPNESFSVPLERTPHGPTMTDIRTELERLTASASARGSILFVTDQNQVLRSLTHVTGCISNAVELELRSAPFAALENRVAKLWWIPDRTARIDDLTGLFGSLGSAARAIQEGHEWRSIKGSAPTRRHCGVVVFLSCPKLSGNELDLSVLQRLVDASLPSQIRRDTLFLTSFDEAVSSLLSRQPAVGTLRESDLYFTFAKVSATIFDAPVTAIYRYDATSHSLNLAAEYRHTAQTTSGSSSSTRVSHAPKRRTVLGADLSLVAAAWQNRQAMQLPDFVPQRSLRPTWEAPSACYEELATPIPGRLASRSSSPEGILTLARLGPDALPFDAYEYALARNLVLRLALLSWTTKGEHAAAELLRPLPRQSTSASRLDDRAYRGGPVPADLARSPKELESILRTIAEYTDSHSATVRVLLPADGVPPDELTLRRIAAWPTERLSDDFPVQRLEDGGTNWKALRSAQPHYVANVSQCLKDDDFLSCRPSTSSALTVPVIVEGRAIGVVNLESPDPNAYSASQGMAAALATRVANLFSSARLEVARSINDLAHVYASAAHGYAKYAEHEAGSAEWSQPAAEEALLTIADGLRRLVLPGTSEEPGSNPRMASTVRATVSAQLARANAELLTVTYDPSALGDLLLSSDQLPLFCEALFNVIVNVKQHHAGPDPELTVRSTSIIGNRELLFCIENDCNYETIGSAAAANLHRIPNPADHTVRGLQDSDYSRATPQLGAYVAGASVRRLGGEVYSALRPSPSPGRARLNTLILLPIRES